MSGNESKQLLWQALFTAIFLGILLFSITYLRTENGKEPYSLGESYYNLRIAKELAQDPFFEEDTVRGEPYYASAYHYLLAFSLMYFNEERTLIFSPIILGLAFALVFAWLTHTMGFTKSNSIFAAGMLAVTPTFLVAFSSLSQNGFTCLLSAVVLALYFEKKHWDYPWQVSGRIYFVLSILSLCLLALTSLVGFVITLVLMAVMSSLQDRPVKNAFLAAIPSIIIMIPFAIFTNYLSIIWKRMGFHAFSLQESFSIFGAKAGLGFFMLLLFLTGMIIIWSYIKTLRLYHLLSLILVVVSLFNPLLRFYSGLIIIAYTVIAVKHLYYTKWELEIIKTGTIILLACALVFSSLSQITSLVNAEPGADAKEALASLKLRETGVVFSQPEFGFLIQEKTGMKTLLDEDSAGNNYDDYKALLQISRLKDAEPIIAKHEIKYFLITPEMKSSEWNNKDRGLLLLIKNSVKFDKIQESKSGFELWQYLD